MKARQDRPAEVDAQLAERIVAEFARPPRATARVLRRGAAASRCAPPASASAAAGRARRGMSAAGRLLRRAQLLEATARRIAGRRGRDRRRSRGTRRGVVEQLLVAEPVVTEIIAVVARERMSVEQPWASEESEAGQADHPLLDEAPPRRSGGSGPHLAREGQRLADPAVCGIDRMLIFALSGRGGYCWDVGFVVHIVAKAGRSIGPMRR